MSISCLTTTVVNNTATRRPFPLPPHNIALDPNEQYTVLGDLFANYGRNKRQLAALLDCINRGDLAIIRTPAPHFYDAVTDMTKTIRINSGAVGVIDPCTGAYSSSEGA